MALGRVTSGASASTIAADSEVKVRHMGRIEASHQYYPALAWGLHRIESAYTAVARIWVRGCQGPSFDAISTTLFLLKCRLINGWYADFDVKIWLQLLWLTTRANGAERTPNKSWKFLRLPHASRFAIQRIDTINFYKPTSRCHKLRISMSRSIMVEPALIPRRNIWMIWADFSKIWTSRSTIFSINLHTHVTTFSICFIRSGVSKCSVSFVRLSWTTNAQLGEFSVHLTQNAHFTCSECWTLRSVLTNAWLNVVKIDIQPRHLVMRPSASVPRFTNYQFKSLLNTSLGYSSIWSMV